MAGMRVPCSLGSNPAAYRAFCALMEHALDCGCGPRTERITSTRMVFRIAQRECPVWTELERAYREIARSE